MEKVKQILLPVLAGMRYGFLSFWWIIFAAMCAFPGTSPGSRDWEEDVFFIPIGYIMFIIFIVVTGIIIFKNRKRIKPLILFMISTLLTAGIVFGITWFDRTEQQGQMSVDNNIEETGDDVRMETEYYME